jgi:hypothetical protein
MGRVIAMVPIAQWISYLVLGAVFIAAGTFLWGKRHPS